MNENEEISVCSFACSIVIETNFTFLSNSIKVFLITQNYIYFLNNLIFYLLTEFHIMIFKIQFLYCFKYYKPKTIVGSIFNFLLIY